MDGRRSTCVDLCWVAKRWKTCDDLCVKLITTKVSASAREAWLNGVASRPEFTTCTYLRVRLARAFQLSHSRTVGGAVASRVSALDSGASGPRSRPGWGHCFVFLGKTLYSKCAVFTQVHKWVPANLMLGEPCDGLTSHPGGSRNTCSRFMLQKPS